MQSRVQRRVQTDELRIILALESSWTVSIDGKVFVPAAAAEIEVAESSILFRRRRRKILAIEWLRPNIARVRTSAETLTFYPGNQLPPLVETRRRRRTFQTRLSHALGLPARGSSGRYSGMYPKFISGNRAAIAVDPEESQPVIDGIMRAAILWPERLHRRVSVIVPAQRSRTIVTRLRAMPAMQQRFDWQQWDGDAIRPLDISLPESETHVHEYREPKVASEVARICALAPDLLQAVPHIPGKAVSIRLRGLEIARVAETGTTYPMGEPLPPLIEMLAAQRRPGSRHPLARAYEERWLESNLVRQIQDLIPVVAERIYPQVPSFSVEDRRIIDLLAISESGRLVVIEVKASADPDLPFQAFDYWLAVERHRRAGDFAAKGYFTGVKISDEPAILIMVAPLLSFHSSMDELVAELPRTVPWIQAGINQSWKREIKILRRKGALG